MDDLEVIKEAAAALGEVAHDIRFCHTLGPNNDDWTGEPEAKAEYERLNALVGLLFAIANRMTTQPNAKPGA